MASSTTGLTITLKTSDGEEFVISEMVAMQSQTLRSMIEDDCAQNAIPLPNVNSKILSKVIQFCKFHAEAEDMPTSPKMSEEDIRKWDMEFVELDQTSIFELLLAANYLNISKLLNASCQKVADMIKDMSVEEIRETFNIENDFTPEEEEAVRLENQWAFR